MISKTSTLLLAMAALAAAACLLTGDTATAIPFDSADVDALSSIVRGDSASGVRHVQMHRRAVKQQQRRTAPPLAA